jgi:membrane protease YdiL (CAAX protease family)
MWQSEPPDAWLRSAWLSLLSNLVPGIGEEVMFRGYLLTGLVRAWGKRAGLAVMVVLFALPHLTVSGAAETHWLLFTALLSLPGLVLGWATLRAGSLWLPMGIHFAWDLAYDVFNLTGGSHPGLFGAVARQQGPGWILGTAFGVEVGLAGVMVAALVGGGVWLWTRRSPEPNTYVPATLE